jgi:phosphatidylinositol alpha-mannosyltransferase
MPLLPFFALQHSPVPTIATFHAYSGNELGYRHGRRLLDRYFAKIDGRIAVSVAAKSFIGRYFPGEYTVIPNGVDVERFQHAEPFPELRGQAVNLLFVGRLEERKGFSILLRAFAQLRRRMSSIRLVVVGAYEASEAAQHEAQLASAGVSDVLFAGYATPARLPRYYASSDVVCAPSLGSESFGMVLLEAMAAGKPIIASRIPGYRDVVDDGVEGLLAEPGDVDALVRALETVIGNRELREELGRRGSIKAEQYSWRLVGDRVASMYEDVLARSAETTKEIAAVDHRCKTTLSVSN